MFNFDNGNDDKKIIRRFKKPPLALGPEIARIVCAIITIAIVNVFVIAVAFSRAAAIPANIYIILIHFDIYIYIYIYIVYNVIKYITESI